MIGLSRLERAISDAPKGGMQTGDPKITLKLCDALRIKAELEHLTAELAALATQAADAFGDGYYDGFIDGTKFQDSEDLNTKTDSGLAGIAEEAMRCSEIAEGEKSKRLGIVSRQALAAQVAELQLRISAAERVEAIFSEAPELSFDDCVKLFPDDLRQLRADAVLDAIKFCNHHMAFPVNHGKVDDKVIAVDDLIVYAETLRQGGSQ